MMLQLEVTLFAYPGEDCGCEKSIGPDYNVALSMNLQKIKFNFMLENSLRIVFYAVNDIGKLFLTKATADTGLESGEEEQEIEEEEEIDDFESQDYGTEAEKAVEDDFWKTFDLKQEKFVPGLDVKIEAPVINVPNLNVPGAKFVVDCGTVEIKSEKEIDTNRWINHQGKEFSTMKLKVISKEAEVKYINDEVTESEPILKEEEVNVTINVP